MLSRVARRSLSSVASLRKPELPTISGKHCPVLGLGTYRSEPGEVGRAVEVACRAGYRHIDCAWIYGNEKEIGDALRRVDVPREDLFVTDKLWNTFHRPKHVRSACLESLRLLQLDVLDLYLIHWTGVSFQHVASGDPFPTDAHGNALMDEVPLEETWEAMAELVKEGLVRHIGVSNASAEQFRKISGAADVQPFTNQVECNPYCEQSDLAAACGVPLTSYTPLGSHNRHTKEDAAPPPLLEHPNVRDTAERLHLSPAQVVLAWNLAKGNIVIPKSVTPERIEANFGALGATLDAEAMDAVDALSDGFRFRFINPTTFGTKGEYFFRDVSQ